MSRFFSDEAYEPQVDPFNAGEPVMPWDDPEALHDDDSCDLPADGSYTADEKPRDDYRAPERPTTQRKTPAVPQRKTPPASQRKAQPTGNTQKQPSVPNGKSGRQRVFHKTLVLMVALVILINIFGSCASDVFDTSDGEATSSDNTALDYSQEQMNADEQVIYDAITDRMDGLTDDSDAVATARQGLDKKLKSYVGYTSEELGIDADAYAAWFFSQMSYHVDYAYTYDEETGSTSVEITSPLAYQIASDFYDKASDYLMSNQLYGSYDDNAEAAPLTSEQQDQMRGFFADVLAATVPDDNGYMVIAAIKDADGTWQLSEQAIQGELDYLLGIN